MPDSLSLLNVNDAGHLECLTWAVYDGALLVDVWPELPGNHQWCTVLASLYKHIYRGCDDVAHCPPYTLASWDSRRGLRHFVKREGSALCGVASGEHPSPGGGPGEALDAPPGHQPKGVGAGTPTACHLTCCQGATTGDPHPPMLTPCPSWPQLSTFHPMPGPAAPVGEWPGPPLTRRTHGRMTSKPRTRLSAM